MDRLRQGRFSRAVRASNDCEGWHAALGGARRQFAENLVVFARRGAG
jgi:hypothetical protein